MILKVKPINFELKTDLEKESILISYHNFLKSSNFNFQIIIKSFKQDMKTIINTLQKENENMLVESMPHKILNEYTMLLEELSNESKTSYKEFFIVLHNKLETDEKILDILSKNKTLKEQRESLKNDKLKKIFLEVETNITKFKGQKKQISETLGKAGNVIEIMKGENLVKLLQEFYR